MGRRLTHVPFDIETTGFAADDRITVVGFALPLGCRVFLNTNGRDVDVRDLERTVADRFDVTVQLSCHDSEAAVLAALAPFVSETIAEREYLLVAYNGERYRGGFDLPFMRTRCARHGRPWPFDDVPYTDLLPLVRSRFNTTCDGDDETDLAGAYETLVGGEYGTLDPFADSAEAVTAFEDGAFTDLVAHNLADVLRTDALASLLVEYCSTSDFSLKSLTPSVRDPNLQ